MSHVLTFREDGSFKILQLTDLHIGGTEDDSTDKRTYEAIRHVIEYENPNLIAVTGDLIWSNDVDHNNPEKSYRTIVGYIASFGIPFAIVYGNHDSEENLERKRLMEINCEFDQSLAVQGPENIHGVGNYSLEVKGYHSEENKSILYFLDSGDYAPEGIGGYGWIHPDQVNWFKEEERKYSSVHPTIPGVAFFHIPLPEYKEAISEGTFAGNKFEQICSPIVNSGMFTAMLETKNVMGAFVGHDHDNDFIAELHGIALAYGRITGYNVYGRFERGARVIQLFEGERKFKTWIRQTDGVVLNEYIHEHSNVIK